MKTDKTRSLTLKRIFLATSITYAKCFNEDINLLLVYANLLYHFYYNTNIKSNKLLFRIMFWYFINFTL